MVTIAKIEIVLIAMVGIAEMQRAFFSGEHNWADYCFKRADLRVGGNYFTAHKQSTSTWLILTADKQRIKNC